MSNLRICAGLGKSERQIKEAVWRVYIKFTVSGKIKQRLGYVSRFPQYPLKLLTIQPLEGFKTTLVSKEYSVSIDFPTVRGIPDWAK